MKLRLRRLLVVVFLLALVFKVMSVRTDQQGYKDGFVSQFDENGHGVLVRDFEVVYLNSNIDRRPWLFCVRDKEVADMLRAHPPKANVRLYYRNQFFYSLWREHTVVDFDSPDTNVSTIKARRLRLYGPEKPSPLRSGVASRGTWRTAPPSTVRSAAGPKTASGPCPR